MIEKRFALMACFLVMLSCNGSGSSQSPEQATARDREIRSDPDGEAVQLVREYVLRDSKGERLASNSWFREVVEFEEPGYDELTVIRSYDVAPPVTRRDTVFVAVQYDRIGSLSSDESGRPHFVLDSSRETVTFVVVRTEGGWKIADPAINQHVTVEAVLEAFRIPAEIQRQMRSGAS